MTSTATANGTRLRTYEEIEAGRKDISVRVVQFMPTDQLVSTVEEYEAKASEFDGPLGDLMRRIAQLGGEELLKREAPDSRKVIR